MRLWKKFNGEPFMINPQIGILGLGLNPRRKKRGKKAMARQPAGLRRYWATHRRGRKHAPRRRRRSYRRNPYPIAGLALNPRRRRGRGRRYGAAMRRATGRAYGHNPRRSYRRNPGGGRRIMGFSLPPLQSVLYAGVGFVGVPITEGFLNQWLPLSITSSTLGKYAVRIGSVLGLTWLGKLVLGKQAATMIGIGGGAYVLVTAVKEFAPGIIPGLAAYSSAGPAMLGAYTPSRGRNFSTMGAPPMVLPFQASGQPTASRFRRF